MKIEIDLNDILGDEEYGVETLQDSVKRQVVAALTKQIQSGIQGKIDREVSTVITETIKNNVENMAPKLFEDLLNTEFTQVDRYGDKRGPTTFRKEMVRVIQEEMVYKKGQYNSDKNTFTRAVDSIVDENVSEFKTSFNKLVNEAFTRECFEYAQNEMKKKLGIK